MIPNRSLTEVTKVFRTAVQFLSWGGLALLFPLAAAGCGHGNAATESRETSTVTEVGTINPQRKNLTREVEQPGYLRPYEQTPIYTKIAGFAKEPNFDIGDRVKKGELLVELYVPEVVQELRVKASLVKQAHADLKQATKAAAAAQAAQLAAKDEVEAKQASIDSAEAQVQRWKAEDVRAKKLLGKGIFDQQTADEQKNQLMASEASRDEAKANFKAAQAKYIEATAQYDKFLADIEVADAHVEVAQSTHDQWRDWLSYAQITSPYDGIVTVRNVHSGHFLQPSNSGSTSKAAEPLFVVMRIDTMRCTVDVPEKDAVLVKEHDKALVQFPGLPGVEVVGEVTRCSYSLDVRARTLRVEVDLKNTDDLFRPGLFAKVKLLAKLNNSWTIPDKAILKDILANGDHSYCFVVENGKVYKTFLQVGAQCDEGVQVVAKQRPGGKWEKLTGKEAIVTTNPKSLEDGQAVTLQAQKSP